MFKKNKKNIKEKIQKPKTTEKNNDVSLEYSLNTHFNFKSYFRKIKLLVFSLILLASIIILFLYKEIILTFPFITETKFDFTLRLLLIITTIMFFKFIIETINESLEKKLEKNNATEEQIFLTITLWNYGLGFLAFFIVLSILIKDWKVVLTSIGIIGAGIAVALQHFIMNFVGWMMIIFQKPFRIGDRIEIKGIRGDVFDITLNFTRLRKLTQDDQPTGIEVLIPNETFVINPLQNFTHPTKFIWDRITVSITYESDTELAKKVFKKILEKNLKEELLLAEKVARRKRRYIKNYSADTIKPKVMLSLNDSSIDVSLLYLVLAHDKNQKRTKIINDIILAVSKTDKIEFAYPHMQLVFDKNEKHK